MDERYKESARIVFDALTKQKEHARQLQGEYGKWLISSLLFLHTAAIGGIAFKLQNIGPVVDSLWWFVGGIVFALASGFAAWWNFTFAEAALEEMADYKMLHDPEGWPKVVPKAKWIKFFLWCAVVFGVSSVMCLIVGARCVAESLKHLQREARPYRKLFPLGAPDRD